MYFINYYYFYYDYLLLLYYLFLLCFIIIIYFNFIILYYYLLLLCYYYYYYYIMFQIIPFEVFELQQLTVLKLRNNPVREITSDIATLKSLKTLVISFCLIATLPLG